MRRRTVPGETEFLVKSAGPEIDCDRADDADRVETGERLEFARHREDEDRDGDRDQKRNAGHAVAIESGQLFRHLAVLRHHVDDADEGDDRGVDRAEKEEAKDDADDEPEGGPEPGSDDEGSVVFAKEPQHVLRVGVQLGREGFRERQHRPAEEGGAEDHLDRHRDDRLGCGPRDFGMLRGGAGIEFHHPGDVGDRFHAAEGEDHADKLRPRDRVVLVRRLKMRRLQVTAAQEDDHDDRQDGGNRQINRDTAAVFRTEKIHHADHDDQPHRRDPRMFRRYAEVAHRRPAAQRSGNNKIGDQQEGPGRGEEAALFPGRGINAAAIGEMRADDNVIETDDGGERADGKDEREGGEARRDKSEADDIGFACAPVAIEKGGGPLPVDVAWPMHTRRFD